MSNKRFRSESPALRDRHSRIRRETKPIVSLASGNNAPSATAVLIPFNASMRSEINVHFTHRLTMALVGRFIRGDQALYFPLSIPHRIKQVMLSILEENCDDCGTPISLKKRLCDIGLLVMATYKIGLRPATDHKILVNRDGVRNVKLASFVVIDRDHYQPTAELVNTLTTQQLMAAFRQGLTDLTRLQTSEEGLFSYELQVLRDARDQRFGAPVSPIWPSSRDERGLGENQNRPLDVFARLGSTPVPAMEANIEIVAAHGALPADLDDDEDSDDPDHRVSSSKRLPHPEPVTINPLFSLDIERIGRRMEIIAFKVSKAFADTIVTCEEFEDKPVGILLVRRLSNAFLFNIAQRARISVWNEDVHTKMMETTRFIQLFTGDLPLTLPGELVAYTEDVSMACKIGALHHNPKKLAEVDAVVLTPLLIELLTTFGQAEGSIMQALAPPSKLVAKIGVLINSMNFLIPHAVPQESL